jgi:Tol biopolymer transport system component/DNA-binding winged helix-turn-helix (wHTH) protein
LRERAVKATSKRSSGVRFGQFELDLSEERLLKKGLAVRIENQPLQILTALLGNPGEMVTREDLCASLWPDGTYVDFDEGLNTAIKKLRYALGDSAESPVFIETVPRRGYRFIAPVQTDPVQNDEDSSEHMELISPGNGNGHPTPEESPSDPPVLFPSDSQSKWSSNWVIGFGIIFLGICGLLSRLIFPPQLHVTQLTRLTTSGRIDPWGRLSSDGSRLFFLERDGDHWNDRQVSVAGGESMPFGPTGRNIRFHAVSPDQSEILFSPFLARLPDLPLWSMPLIGGSPRRVGNILANGAAFSPDGASIAFTTNNGVFVANRDGSGVRQVAAVLDCWDIAWSPDGKILRFHAHGPRLWQVTPTGQDLHLFLPAWTAWEGRWTADGSYYIFTASKDGHTALWALRESPSLPWMHPVPVQLTFPPLLIGGGLPSRDGHAIYAMGGLSEQIDVVDYDPATHQFKPVMPGFGVKELAYSPDRQWVFYNDWNHLWRSRPDGSDRLQLAGAPLFPGPHFARWSPDSKQILFNSPIGDKPEIYLVSAAGGAPQKLLPPSLPGRGAAWSPDGQTISFAVVKGVGEAELAEPGVYFFDVAQGRSTRIPGSDGVSGTAWSPDGRFLAAQSADESTMKLLDLRTHHWTVVASSNAISFPVWSPDSTLYFQDLLGPGEPVYRFQPGSSGPQRVFSFEDVLQGSGAIRCAFQGFSPDGSVLVQVSRGGGDIYSLTVGP